MMTGAKVSKLTREPRDFQGTLLVEGDRVESTKQYSNKSYTGTVAVVHDDGSGRVSVTHDQDGKTWRSAPWLWRKANV